MLFSEWDSPPTTTRNGGIEASAFSAGVKDGTTMGLAAKDIGGLVVGFVGLFVILGGLILWRTRKLAPIPPMRLEMEQVLRTENSGPTTGGWSESHPSARVEGDDNVYHGGRLADTI
jgi:hypothetical protein